jgi:hypothetical protein
VRIHSGPGDSVSTKRPDIHTRPNSDQGNCLLDWRSPYTRLEESIYKAAVGRTWVRMSANEPEADTALIGS